ncbi:CDGSH iron-sulfur domain-containing protein 1-like [Callorhinchus milii]|uniref:CDGSH iron sulfur domain 1 n=1 Tax=Callorhinchus milii TaxID=7868 RepID=V9LDB2_CALMI|nr:CDGSH iron-sulfur domain-containing protein 1-like [Callorhinchus milii]
MFGSGYRVSAAPLVLTAVLSSYLLYRLLSGRKLGEGRVNLGIHKNLPEVVDTVDIEDMGQNTVFCRCWRSNKFPYCDGSHSQHNAVSGDNVGPLIIIKS